MALVPSGTVTMLMTDIEGSTRKWEEQGDAFIPTLLAHNKLVRDALAGLNGYEVKTEGDSFFYVFSSAREAVQGAFNIQHALVREDLGIKVRIGIHSGEPSYREGAYFGPAVNRADRVKDAAHGGQILLSAATHALVVDDLPPGVVLIDCGEHRLRDLGSPERIFQVSHPELPWEFPPLRTLETQPNNLPAQRTRFVGRRRELAALSELRARRSARLVTLTGSGGVGKTRFALQFAAAHIDDFPGGIWFVPMVDVDDPALVAAQIASVVVGESTGSQDPMRALTHFLRDKQGLLVLDSVEKCLDGASVIGELLAALPRLSCLVTSRVLLQVSGEHEFQVPSLSLEESLELLEDRAQSVRAGIQLDGDNRVAAIDVCARLDGLPLAIELAAARLRGMTMTQMAHRLERRFDLLAGGGRDLPDRQRTMRTALAWSYEPLSEQEKALFSQLAVFSGGFFLEAAEDVCQAGEVLDGIFSLRDCSLLASSEALGETRYQMLTLVREYALEHLADADSLHQRHAVYYLDVARRWAAALNGPEQRTALTRLDVEYPNLEAAMRWCHDTGDWKMFAEFIAAIGEYAHTRGRITPAAIEAVQHAIRGLTDSEDTASLATLLLAMAALAWMRSDFAEATVMATTSLKYFRAQGLEEHACRALNLLGLIATDHGDTEAALKHFETGLEIAARNRYLVEKARLLQNLSGLELRQQQTDSARAHAEECLRINREIGDNSGTSYQLHTLGLLDWEEGNRHRAARRLLESVTIREQMGDRPGLVSSMRDIGLLMLATGRIDLAADFVLTAHRLEAESMIAPSSDDEAACGAVRTGMSEPAYVAASARIDQADSSEAVGRLRDALEKLA